MEGIQLTSSVYRDLSEALVVAAPCALGIFARLLKQICFDQALDTICPQLGGFIHIIYLGSHGSLWVEIVSQS